MTKFVGGSIKEIPLYVSSCKLWEDSLLQMFFTVGILSTHKVKDKIATLRRISSVDDLTRNEKELLEALERWMAP